MSLSLRTTTAEDWRAFRDIRLRALADSPDAFSATLADAREYTESMWRERASGSGPTIVVFDDEETPVAMGGVFTAADAAEAWLWGMWTAPDSRGRGHGSRVLAELLLWCRMRERRAHLHVTEGNTAARDLYIRHGFRSTGEWSPLREGSSTRVESLAQPDH